ncbi:glycosyltransferase family 4 protein [Bacillus sp. UMB0893]|uniref:glycosyltransferase family 4 protein n=1 Tax=Bacillus sp. UMB0893 TaxID=2066053 RepID=UPI0015DEDA70|nr:glycosyltransferase family 4 protein [Bacillus sp. UMB0893]
MKKICVITTVHQAYDGRIYYKQSMSLAKAGYDVSLIAPKPDREVNDQGLVKLLPIEKPKKEWKRLLRSFSVIKTAKETKADLYHFHDPELLIAGLILRILTRKPVIFDAHEHYPNAIMSKKYLKKWLKTPIRVMYELIERMILPFLSGVIYTTDEVGERYQKYTHCKIENYPLYEMFEQVSTNNKNGNTILYLGGITPIRGIEQLIDAFSEVTKHHKSAQLIFVGSFESKSFEYKINNKINSRGLTDKIEFIGKVPYTEIERYLSKASIGIIPYLPVPNHLVCLPNKLFEYMAAGVTTIASDFPHYRKVVEGAGSGLLVNPEKPQSIADAIVSLLKDPKKCNEIGVNGRKSFEKIYNWNTEEKKLLVFYRTFLIND